MPITSAPAPSTIAQSALDEASQARNLKRPAGMDRPMLDAGGADPVEAAAADPLPVYTIPIETLADEEITRIDDAVQRGWRVRTVDARGEQLVDLAESGAPVSVRRGASTEILMRAASLAEEAADADAAYEARLIDFGQLGLSALWLHQDDGPDRFFSLDREPRERDEVDLLEEASQRARRYLSRGNRGGAIGVEPDIGG